MKQSQEWWCLDLGSSSEINLELFDRLLESLLRFTPDLVPGRKRIFMEMSRIPVRPKPDTFLKRVQVLARRIGLDATSWRFGIADTIPKAWVQTRWRAREARLLPVEAYFDFIDPLNHFECTRPERERLTCFRSLGMKNLEYLFTVPKTAWLVRFGEEFDTFLEHFEFGERLVWKAWKPSETLIEETRWNAEEWVSDAEGLIFRLKPLVDRLCSRLYSLGRAIRKIEIILKLDRPVPDRKIELGFAFPQTSRTLLLKLLREKLSQEMDRNPLTDPVVEARIGIRETERRSQGSARFAFSSEEERSEEEREKWVELISYLGTKYGGSLLSEKPSETGASGDGARAFQAELTAHPLPERSWKKTWYADPSGHDGAISMQEVSPFKRIEPARPVLLFQTPETIHRTGPWLRRKSGAFEERYRIRSFRQEERIEGYEWDVEDTGGFERTYFRVEVENPQGKPEEWWVYRDELLGKLMLHGLY
jgi:hypothetical protein